MLAAGERRGLNREGIQTILTYALLKTNMFRYDIGHDITYKQTSNNRIRTIFSEAINLSDDQLNDLKVSDENLFEAMYGNNAPAGLQLEQIPLKLTHILRGGGSCHILRG